MTVRNDEMGAALGWIGELPPHWSVRRLKFISECCDSRRVPLNSSERADKIGNIPYWGANSIQGFVDEALFDEDIVLLGEDGAPFFDKTKSVAFWSSGPIWPNNHVHVLRPKGIYGPFLVYALNNTDFANFVDGSTRDKLTQSAMSGIPVPFPPLSEQRTIAAFLDRETGKIDALLDEQERLIELLKEKRQAVISHTVTKGLNPNAPMKASGVEWLGEVPEHWDIVPVGALFRFVKRQDGDTRQVLSVYRDYGVIPKDSRDDNINKTPEDLSKYQTVLPGDLVVNKMKAWQGSLGVSNYPGITSPDYAVFEPRHTAAPNYLNLLLRCSLLPSVYRAISNGIRPDQWRIEPDKFRELRVPFPPPSDQDAISSYLVDAVSRWDGLCNEAETAIVLLQERRSALISAAVTGKIDVQEAAQADVEAA